MAYNGPPPKVYHYKQALPDDLAPFDVQWAYWWPKIQCECNQYMAHRKKVWADRWLITGVVATVVALGILFVAFTVPRQETSTARELDLRPDRITSHGGYRKLQKVPRW